MTNKLAELHAARMLFEKQLMKMDFDPATKEARLERTRVVCRLRAVKEAIQAECN